MAYDTSKLTKLAALKALAQKVQSDYALKKDLTALSDKVEGLITAGGEPNTLEGIKVNGTLLTLTDKIANILIQESTANGNISVNNVDVPIHGLAALAYKSEVSESDLAAALKAIIDAKAKQSDLDILTGDGEGSISKMIDAAINKFATDVTDTFTKKTVAVEGANGYTAKDYNVWVFEPAIPYENAAVLKVTLS